MNSQPSNYPDSWYQASTSLLAHQPVLQDEISADVCVVGAGYTGLSTALHLAQSGRRVVILESDRIGWGASGRNGGHVGTGQRADQLALENWFGMSTARDLWRLGLDAVELVESLIKEHGISCELGRGNIHLAAKKAHAGELRNEVEHLQSVYGYDKIEGVDGNSLQRLTSGQGFHYGVVDHGARHLHPLKYCIGLARAALDAGAVVYEGSKVARLEPAGSTVTVYTPGGSVRADKVVLACNGYLGSLFPPIASHIMPINNFVVATEPLSDALTRAINPLDMSLSDSLFVVNYWKLTEDRRLIFGGGETYSDQFPASIIDFVRPRLLNIYPELENTRLEYGWGGTLAITRNRMPDFGVRGGNIYYAHGFSGHGVPTATLAGKLVAAAIEKGDEDFDLMAGLKTAKFPGGPLLRKPSLVAGMLFYSLLDRIGR